MNKSTKAFLTALAVILGTLVFTIGGGALIGFVWVNTHSQELLESGQKVESDAKQFAKKKSSQECLGEVLSRGQECDDLLCNVNNKLFLEYCLTATPYSKEFCEGVPAPGEIIQSVKWRLQECNKRGVQKLDSCTGLLGEVQDYCTKHLPSSH